MERELHGLNPGGDMSAEGPDNSYGAAYERESRWIERDDDQSQSWPTVQRPSITNPQYQWMKDNLDPFMQDHTNGVLLWKTVVTVVEEFVRANN